MSGWWVVTLTCLVAAWLLSSARPERRVEVASRPAESTESPHGILRRYRGLWAACAGAGAFSVLGGVLGVTVGLVVGAVVWGTATRAEDPEVRRSREAAAGQLPHLVGLIVTALEAGQPPDRAISVACDALPGPGAERLAPVVARLRLGLSPLEVWTALQTDPALWPLARTMTRVHRSGAPVAEAVRRLADDLQHEARTRVEDRARTVGVKAAVPLGLCLLPAFLLLGIVPMAVAAMGALSW